MSDILIWILLIFVFIIIIGLYNSEFTPLKLSEKQKILDINYVTENFTPSISTSTDQTEGASEYYHWGLPEEKTHHKEHHHEEECHHTCDHTCPKRCPHKCHVEPVHEECHAHHPSPKNRFREICYNCDITLNKNIDKYVLKSSVPACPDMSEYVTKNMIPATTNLDDYILKSEVKPCEKVDVSQYILKSEIPACPNCPTCPECPICPVCPEPTRCKEIHEYDIEDHPDFSDYIKKDDILNSPLVKEFIKKREEIQKAILEEEALSKVKDSLKDKCEKYCKDNNIYDSAKYINKNDILNDPSVQDYIKKMNAKHKAMLEEELYNSDELCNNPKFQEYVNGKCNKNIVPSSIVPPQSARTSSRMEQECQIRQIVEEESKKNDKPIFPMNLNVNGFYTGDSLYAGV